MYYRRTFSGTVQVESSGSPFKVFGISDRGAVSGPTSTTYYPMNHSIARNKILCNAVSQVLRDCGLVNAKSWFEVFPENTTDNVPYVFIDAVNSNAGFYLYQGINTTSTSYSFQNAAIFAASGSPSTGSVSIVGAGNYRYATAPINSTVYRIFESISFSITDTYSFGITLKGDTKGCFNIYIGSSAYPQAEGYSKTGLAGFICIRVRIMKDLADSTGNTKVISVMTNLTTNGGDQVDNPALTTEWANIIQPQTYDMNILSALSSLDLSSSTALTGFIYTLCNYGTIQKMQDNYVALVPAFTMCTRFQYMNTYFYGGLPVNDEYYKINDKIYYRTGYLLVLCDTEPDPEE